MALEYMCKLSYEIESQLTGESSLLGEVGEGKGS